MEYIKKARIEVGQIIYVETKAMFLSNTPALSEYQVIKSIYEISPFFTN